MYLADNAYSEPAVATSSVAYRVLEYGFILLALLLVTDSLTPLLYWGGGVSAEDAGEANPTRLIVSLALYMIGVALLIRRPKPLLDIIIRRPDIVALCLLPLLSVFWSDAPGTVFKRAGAHLLSVLFVCYLVLRLPPEALLRRLVICFALAGAASFLLAVAAPHIAIRTGEGSNAGAWVGVFGHKATLGRMGVVAIFCALLSAPRTRFEKLARWFVVIAYAALLVLSGSRASWALLAVGLALMGVLKVLASQRFSVGLKVSAALIVSIVVVVGALVAFPIFLEASGRDLTFSGRTKLWTAAISVFEQHGSPALGVGYRNFWLGNIGKEVRSYIPGWGGVPGHGHNGYLDAWLELGWPGLTLVTVFLLASSAVLVVAILRRPKQQALVAYLLILLLFILNNFSNSLSLKASDASWMLAIAAAIYGTLALKRNVAVEPV